MVYKKLNENVHGLSQKACRHQQNKELSQWLFFETIIRAFQWERERASEPLGYPPPPFPQLLIKRTRRSEQFKIFHKKYHDKKCYFETSYIFKGPL